MSCQNEKIDSKERRRRTMIMGPGVSFLGQDPTPWEKKRGGRGVGQNDGRKVEYVVSSRTKVADRAGKKRGACCVGVI